MEGGTLSTCRSVSPANLPLSAFGIRERQRVTESVNIGVGGKLSPSSGAGSSDCLRPLEPQAKAAPQGHCTQGMARPGTLPTGCPGATLRCEA